MVKLKLDGVDYRFPKRLEIGLWSQLAQLDLGEPLMWPRALHLVTGAPLDLLIPAPHKALELGMGFLLNLMGQRKTADHKPFEELTFGQWVDLDIWLIWGVDRHMGDIISILCPEATYADEALWVIEKYSRWRLSVYRSYSALFGLNDPGADEPSEVDKMAIARGWYAVMVRLAQGDILRLDPVAEQPLKKALNMLAYQKQVDMEEAARQQEISRKYDLQRNSRSLR